MVLLAPMVTALQTLLEVCRAYAAPHDIVYNTTKTVCVPSDQSNHRVGTQQESDSEMRNLLRRGVSLPVGHVMTAGCRDDKDIKKQFMRQNAIGNMLFRIIIKTCSPSPRGKTKLFINCCRNPTAPATRKTKTHKGATND